MKTIFASALVAGTVLMASPAMAVTTINMVGTADYQVGQFGNARVTTGTGFTDDYNFTVPSTGALTGTVSTVSVTVDAGIKLTAFIVNGVSALVTYDASKNVYSATVPTQISVANPQTLSVKYDVTKVGAYQGNVSWTRNAVPEPATWALMILGFGVVGYAMRRRPSVRFAQAI